MTVRPKTPSHPVLISPRQAVGQFALRERKCCAPVVVSRIKFVMVVLAALSLPLGSASFAADEGPKPPNQVPTKKVRGRYTIKVAGHYVGSGDAHATSSGIKLSARVKDPDGKEMTLSARKLEVANDRFSGKGTLGGMEVEFDGRVDPPDKRGEEVLKKGRITFTFRVANGKYGRGAGDQRQVGSD
jgi:hypothetical protein